MSKDYDHYDKIKKVFDASVHFRTCALASLVSSSCVRKKFSKKKMFQCANSTNQSI